MGWQRVRSDVSVEELAKIAKKMRDGRVRIKIQAIVLLAQGKPQRYVAEALGVSVRSIPDWIERYNREGINGLQDKPRSGAPMKLKDIEGFRERIIRGPIPDKDGVITWSGQQIGVILKEEFNSFYSLSGIYNLLHYLKLSSLKPRPRHPEAEDEEQELF
ncbi:MAG: helix-turn-helix domain-containing protein [bacterium]